MTIQPAQLTAQKHMSLVRYPTKLGRRPWKQKLKDESNWVTRDPNSFKEKEGLGIAVPSAERLPIHYRNLQLLDYRYRVTVPMKANSSNAFLEL